MGVGRRRGFVLGLFLALSAAFTACRGNDSSAFKPELSVEVTELVFGSANEGKKTFNLVSNTSWSALCNASWCSVTPIAGSNNATVTVNVQKNDSNVERHTTVVLRAGPAKVEVKLRQGFAPQPRLTHAQFSSDCSAVELLGEADIQPSASYANSFGSIDSLCQQSAPGEETGFRCVLNATQFMPGKHSARWTVEDSFGGTATSAPYAFQTTLSGIGPIAFPLQRLMPSAVLGRDNMVGRQVLSTGMPHPLGGCWGSATLRGSIAAGAVHTCALQVDSTVRCWGGQVESLTGLGPVVAISAGWGHTCALQSDGRVRCWGYNSDGQSTVPADLSPAVAISAGSQHTCALRAGGAVRCWGWNTRGQTNVPGNLSLVAAIAAGLGHTCALQADGTVRCWGDNNDGQTTVPRDLGLVVAISTGVYHTCALQSDGRVRCWGENSEGQSTPPADLSPAAAIVAGNFHTCALEADGTVRCWGYNGDGQSTPPGDLGPVVAIAAGAEHTCALQSTGTVRCWGITSGTYYYGQTNVPENLDAAVQTVGQLAIQ